MTLKANVTSDISPAISLASSGSMTAPGSGKIHTFILFPRRAEENFYGFILNYLLKMKKNLQTRGNNMNIHISVLILGEEK